MILSLLATAFLLLVAYWYLSKPKDLPPGPTGLPLVGYLPWLIWHRNRRSEHFIELNKIYGDIICFRVGFTPILLLTSMSSIKDAFVHKGEAFSGRGLPIFRLMTHGKGIISSEGGSQRINRRFLLRVLRDFGFGKIRFENHIVTEIEALFNFIDNSEDIHNTDTGLDVGAALYEHVANNISAITFGRRLDEKEIKLLVKQLSLAGAIPASLLLLNALPKLMFFKNWPVLHDVFGIDVLPKLRLPLEKFVMGLVKEHKKTFDEDDLSDVVYTYMAEQKKHINSEDSYWWDDDQIKHVAVELLIAGTETTKNTIIWGLILLCQYPEIQKKVQEEIDQVVGSERHISLHDQVQLPFVEAVVLEILRYNSLAPSGVPHCTTEEVQLGSYMIPKSCFVLPNLLSVARDPSVWSAPEIFDPKTHFLAEDGKTVVNREKSIPFSIGRRSCIGESLAKMEVYLFLANIFQRYNVSFPQLPKHPKLEPATGLFRAPQTFQFVFTKRD